MDPIDGLCGQKLRENPVIFLVAVRNYVGRDGLKFGRIRFARGHDRALGRPRLHIHLDVELREHFPPLGIPWEFIGCKIPNVFTRLFIV